jgi:glutamate racemase
MIGLFDTGLGGLTVASALRAGGVSFVYYGDQANAPYGEREADEIYVLTQKGVEVLFNEGCKLVVLACNTATCVALRRLQRQWLPGSAYSGHNVIGIVAPTVEMTTNIAWGNCQPPEVANPASGSIAVFGTTRTIRSEVYTIEIKKRRPNAEVIGQACPGLAGAIEAGAVEDLLEAQVQEAVQALLQKTGGRAPAEAILGCTHFPLVEHLFRRHLPAELRILSQPEAVVLGLKDYLKRHPEYAGGNGVQRFITSAAPEESRRLARRFVGEEVAFEGLAK